MAVLTRMGLEAWIGRLLLHAWLLMIWRHMHLLLRLSWLRGHSHARMWRHARAVLSHRLNSAPGRLWSRPRDRLSRQKVSRASTTGSVCCVVRMPLLRAVTCRSLGACFLMTFGWIMLPTRCLRRLIGIGI